MSAVVPPQPYVAENVQLLFSLGKRLPLVMEVPLICGSSVHRIGFCFPERRLRRGTAPTTGNKITRHQYPCRGHRRHCRCDSVSWFDFDCLFRKLTAARNVSAMIMTLKKLVEAYRSDPDSNFP